MTAFPAWGPRDHLAAGLAIVAFVGLVLAFLGADPPTAVPFTLSRPDLVELVVEGPAKAHEARNWALFGEWHRNPADNYQFWRIQSPVWVYPLAGAFRLFGTSYATLQAFSAAFGLLGMLGLWRLLRDVVPGPLGAAALWVYGTAVLVVSLSRSGMTEVLLNAATVWMVWTLLRARAHPAWLVASQGLFALAFFAKQGIVYLFPLLVVANLAVFVSWGSQGRFPRLRWLPVATAAAIAGLTVAWVLQPDYLRTITWNTSHMVTGGGPGEDRAVSVLERLSPARFAAASWTFLPFVGLASLPALVHVTVRAWRQRRPGDGLLAGWGLSTWVTVLVMREWTLRHGSIVVFPTLVLAAVSAQAWLTATTRPRPIRQALVGGLVAAGLVAGTIDQVRRLATVRYTYDRFVRTVEAAAEGVEQPVAIGRFAMPLLLGSRFDLYYVKHIFNTTPEAVLALAPTHFVFHTRRDPVREALSRLELTSMVGDCTLQMRVGTLPIEVCRRDQTAVEAARTR
ncbi:MAG: glycosyltransferase family 39 protein [Myxococcota bacterium]